MLPRLPGSHYPPQHPVSAFLKKIITLKNPCRPRLLPDKKRIGFTGFLIYFIKRYIGSV
jgi:hypothetical protein